ncbi:hypothetical protein BKA61DRAFT_583838 [Leptodontidium sp. MPI-SDFR-AT-0119]|nr:hypothetical protein BKA61DRAFT_583838 [Leptodontidium sp. MPI-SDFR-AT-0119]
MEFSNEDNQPAEFFQLLPLNIFASIITNEKLRNNVLHTSFGPWPRFHRSGKGCTTEPKLSNFNGTVLVYDPYTKAQTILTFPGISGVDPFHISGIDFNPLTGMMYFSANSGRPFVTGGADRSGPNLQIKYSTITNSVVSIANLTTYQNIVLARTGQLVSGFQDMAEDLVGNSYNIATFGSGIAKVSPSGVVTEFYTPSNLNASLSGINGIVSFGNNTPTVVVVPISNLGSLLPQCDGIYMPPMFGQTVILCSADGYGITVFKSTNHWQTATYLGAVLQVPAYGTPTNFGLATNTVQIANSIYMNEEFFFDTGVYDVAGTRSIFPQVDITQYVLDLLANAAAGNPPTTYTP